MTDESKEGDGELEEELDECGLPIRFYGTKDSILAELLLQKTVIEKIAIWYERYLEMLKDSDTATTSSLGIASRVTTILSRHLHLILIAMEDPSFESVHLSTGKPFCPHFTILILNINGYEKIGSMIRYFDSSAKRSLWKYVAASSGEDLKVEHSQSQASESERKLSVTEGVSSVLPSQVEKSHRIKELVLFKDRGVSITSFVLNQVMNFIIM